MTDGPRWTASNPIGKAKGRHGVLRTLERCRFAEHAERLYLDLADEDWRVVEIGRDGWRVITSPPVRFRRSTGMLRYQIPEHPDEHSGAAHRSPAERPIFLARAASS